MAEKVLEIKDLISSYGNIKALKGISLEVDRGEIVALLGANGSGKSTLMKSILGMVHIEQGSIKYEGQELVGKKSHQIVTQGISIVPEGRKIFVEFSVEQNLEIGTFFRKREKSRDDELLTMVFDLFPRLKERRKQPAGTLSGGEQQMLAVGRAIMSDPKLLMLDEPSMGLAPLVVAQVFEVIKKIRDMGVTILLVEQNANMALGICDRAYIMNTGLIRGTGTREELYSDDMLAEAYLGKKG
ncbi:MAG TPA: ABC transporter ATP-binding protein [Candidatus Egerieimonas intestinavium]|uniref:ABC transporter ATP-binding protein n=1 Tax=Candidatus Egerieimonas intestinavium TaxID=2840777 RepID=A0A9D1JFZ6_9FIRM|nr:ABC transporter ATP-binding protein [Candidatus Egerieimonas intestinavium]